MIGAAIAKLSGLADPEQWLVDWVGGGSMTSSGEKINEDTALTCAAVYAAVRILAETVASLPLQVYHRERDGGKTAAHDHPVQHLLAVEPNEETSAFIWRETLQGHLGNWGNGYATIQRREIDGMPLALWQRSPKPERTKPERRSDVDGKIWYLCRDEVGEGDYYRARDMLHIPGFGFDGMIGYSPIALMRDTIGVSKAAERYAGELFQNDARPNGVVTLEGELSPEAYMRTRRAFNESASEHGSRHRIQILEGGASFATTQMDPQSVQMIEARRFGIEEIARAYRVSLHLLQEFTEGAASYASITELGREFIVYTMMPWLKRWENELNRKLLGDGEYFCEFNVNGFLQGDHAARAEFYNKVFQVGGFTVNDILRKENMNPIGDEGDVRFVPMNMVPLHIAVNGPVEEKEPGPKDDDEPDPPPKDDEPPEDNDDSGSEGASVKETREQIGIRAWEKATERLCVKEGKTAVHTAKQAVEKGTNFISWMDQFYDDHRKLCIATFEIAALALRKPAELFADEHIAESRERLLRATECQLPELPDLIAACVAEWHQRALNTGDISDVTDES